jgi:exosortase A-associated hydrolase 2
MREQPVFFNNGNYQLFGIVHHAETTPAKQGVLFCHPFAEEKLWTHRVFVEFARYLAARGYTVLRFDYFGNGDSEGEFEQATVSTALSDISCAFNYLSNIETIDKISLVGLRFGAAMAAKFLEVYKPDNVNKLVLWEPVVDGEQYVQEILRANLATQMIIYNEIRKNREIIVKELMQGINANIEGYEITKNMFTELKEVNLGSNENKFSGEVLVAQFCRDTRMKVKKEFDLIAGAYEKLTIKKLKEDQFWRELKHFYTAREDLFNETFDWLA